MSTDLETELRDALHARAAAVTPERLRPGRVPLRPAHRPVAWILTAAAVTVALVAVTVAALRTGGDSSTPPAGQPTVDVRGTAWRVVAVTQNGHRQSVTSAKVTVAFHLNRDLSASDGVNAYTGHWQQSGATVTISRLGQTYVVYGGSDPAVLAAEAGVQALPGSVRAVRTAAGLRLEAGSVLLDLQALPDTSTGAEPSAKSTHT